VELRTSTRIQDIRYAVRLQIAWDRPSMFNLLVDQLSQRGGSIRVADVYDQAHPRICRHGCTRSR